MVKKTVAIFLSLLSVLRATTITSSIGTSSRDYSTITLWEDDKDGDLVALDQIQVGECYNDAAFNESVTLDAANTNSTHYQDLTVATGQGHNGIWTTSGVRISRNAIATGIITMADGFSRVSLLQIENTASAGAGSNSGVNFPITTGRLDRLIIRGMATTSGVAAGLRLSSGSSRSGSEVRNCIVYNVTATTGTAYGMSLDGAGTISVTLNNCTFYNINETSSGSAYGMFVNGASATLTTKNCAVFNSTTGDFQATAGTLNQSYNISSDATASGTGSLTSKTASNQFVSLTGGSEDFHLKTGADMIEAGNTVSGWAYDIDNDSRPQSTNWDMGADEFIAAAATSKKKSSLIWYH